MKTLITLIIILTIIVILTIWLRIKLEKLKPTEYLYFKPNFSPSTHSDEEFEGDVHK